MDVKINNGERLDEIGFGGLKLIQKPEEFCYGIDAVILASFASEKGGDKIIDLGTGTGIIPLILSHKTKAKEIVGVELQQASFEMAQRNLGLNRLEKKIQFVNCDIKDIFSKDDIHPHSFDMVISNPPYVIKNGGLKNDNQPKTIARHETTAELADFISQAAKLLKDKGDLFMVHRPNRLVDIAVLCRKYKLEPKEIRMVSPNKESKANIILIHCVRNGRPELKFLDPLYVYDEKGNYTDEIMTLYEREGFI